MNEGEKKKRNRIEFSVVHNPRIEEYMYIYSQIAKFARLPFLAMDNVFQTLFMSAKPVHMKLAALAQILIDYNIELKACVMDHNREIHCEVISHRLDFRDNIIRVLHYLSEGCPGMTRLMVI